MRVLSKIGMLVLRPGEAIPWGAWIVPLLAWGSLIFAVYFMLGCLGVILARSMGRARSTHLSAAEIAVAMVEESDTFDHSEHSLPGFFRNPLMWVGFGIPIGVHLLSGLNFYFPDVPIVPLELQTAPLLSEAPWNQIGTRAGGF